MTTVEWQAGGPRTHPGDHEWEMGRVRAWANLYLPMHCSLSVSEAMETCRKSETMSEGHPWWGLKG